MEKRDLRIVFMGTPEFAVESLRALVEGGYNVVAVVTMPDKPVGRHQTELAASPVKQYALRVGLPVLQPAKLKDEAFLEALRALRADLQIVVAFRMLPEVVWAMPPRGTFNLHASLLPQYRGAAPINWAVINGETETGVTTFFLQHAIDVGDVIRRVSIPIAPTDNAGTVHDRLMMLGAQTVVQTVDDILAGTVQTVAQSTLSDAPLKPAPKIFRETCRIAWDNDPQTVCNLVRGLSPYPAAWTELLAPDGKKLTMKVYEAQPETAAHSLPVGAVATDGKSLMRIAVPGGYVRLTDVQLAGKKRMKTVDFLRGFRIDDTFRVE